jgi:hypothetical protein
MKPEEPEDPTKPEEVEEPSKPEEVEEPSKPEEPTPVAAPPLSPDERAVWAQEFKSHDVALAGVIDRERVSFALAKLRLLEDVDISLAADDLEASVGIVDPNRLNEFDFDAFRRHRVENASAQARRLRRERQARARAARVRLRRTPRVRGQVPGNRGRQRRD